MTGPPSSFTMTFSPVAAIFFGDERLYIPDDAGDLLVVDFEVERFIAKRQPDRREDPEPDTDIFRAFEPNRPIEPPPCFVAQASPPLIAVRVPDPSLACPIT